MNIIKPLLISTTILLSANSFAAENKHEAAGETVFKSVCAACHGMAGGMDMNKRIAPPIAGVRKHYLDVYPDKDSFVLAVTSWLEKQDEHKSLMPGAIRHFKIMPPLVISKEDAENVAAYIYAGNLEKPEGMEQHMNEMHHKEGDKSQHDELEQHKIGQHKMGKEQKMRKKMMQQLNLSPEQKSKMKQLMQKKKAGMQPLKHQLKQIEAILTPEQRAKFRQLRQNHKQHN